MESIGMNFSAAEALRRITHKLKKKEKENKSNQSFTPFVIDWWIVCLSSSAEEKKRMKNNQFSKRIVVLLRQFTPSILKKEWTAVQVGFAGHHSLHFHLISLPSIKWMGSVLPLYSASAIFNQHSILKEFHLWLLDSYPLHINYCYNTFWFLPFHSRERNESQQNERNLFLLLVEWNGVWLNGCPPLQASFHSALRGCGLWVFSSRNSIQTLLPLTIHLSLIKQLSLFLLIELN